MKCKHQLKRVKRFQMKNIVAIAWLFFFFLLFDPVGEAVEQNEQSSLTTHNVLNWKCWKTAST